MNKPDEVVLPLQYSRTDIKQIIVTMMKLMIGVCKKRDNTAQVYKGFVEIWIYLGQFVWVLSIGMQYEFRKPCIP